MGDKPTRKLEGNMATKRQQKNRIKLAKLTKHEEKEPSDYHKDRASGHTPQSVR